MGVQEPDLGELCYVPSIGPGREQVGAQWKKKQVPETYIPCSLIRPYLANALPYLQKQP